MTEFARNDLSRYATHWDLELEPACQCHAQTAVAFGYRQGEPVALKVMPCGDDAYRAAQALRCFSGDGVGRCIDEFGARYCWSE
jgi:hypothetical protein